jgi:hypothetical protein
MTEREIVVFREIIQSINDRIKYYEYGELDAGSDNEAYAYSAQIGTCQQILEDIECILLGLYDEDEVKMKVEKYIPIWKQEQ